jgi:hypothetical protein
VYLARAGGTNPWDQAFRFAVDSSWHVAVGRWRSAVDLPVGQARSLQVTSPGFTDRYLRHIGGFVVTEIVTGGSSALLKQDATFIIRPGLAESSCYSFESRNYPGQYLRHKGFRVHKEGPDPGNPRLFAHDATFCAEPGPGGVRLVALNVPGGRMRHILAEVYAARDGGPFPWDNPNGYLPDTTWHLAAPWAP